MTAAEARERGDATSDQRAELHDLIRTRVVTKEWVDQFYRDIRLAQGLSRGRANAALIYLRRLADKSEQPTYATSGQGDELRGLIRTRLVPGQLAMLWLSRLDKGVMTFDEAARTITDIKRLPLRSFVAPDGSRRAAGEPPDGYFALAGTDKKVRCYRIFTRSGGGQVVDQITGDRPNQRRRLRGWQATQVMRAVAVDDAAAAELYGTTRKRCSDCNQPLRDTTQPGFPHGYGPDCWTARQEVAAATQPLRPDPAPQEN